jgi:hypothetical protein
LPLQFKKRIRLLPGVWLNLGKSGVSTSIGGHGATVNFGRRGTRTTVSVPGTGLSYTNLNPGLQIPLTSAVPRRNSGIAKWVAVGLWVFLIGYLAAVIQ